MKLPVTVMKWLRFMNLRRIFGIVGRKGGFFLANRNLIGLLFMASVDGFRQPLGCPDTKKDAVISAMALAYLVSPIDVIPDFIPLLGSKDDELALASCLHFTKEHLKAYRKWKIMQPMLSERELSVLEGAEI